VPRRASPRQVSTVNSVRTPKIAWPTAVGFAATIGVFSFLLDRRYDASLAAVHESLAVREAIDQTLSLLKDAETGQRGYILTGEEPFLAPHAFATQQIHSRLLRLAELTKNDAAESASVREITKSALAKMNELQLTIRAAQGKRAGPARGGGQRDRSRPYRRR
jgi:CHASE3 domain sensor protein